MRWLLLFAIACRSPEPAVQIDVPRLDSATGTKAIDRPLIEAPSLAALPAHFDKPPAIAAPRTLPARAVLDELLRRDVRVAEIVVRAGSAERMVIVEQPSAHEGTWQPIHALTIGAATLEIDGRAVPVTDLPSIVAQNEFTMKIAPDVTLQRLVEVAAGAGGELHPIPEPTPPIPVPAP